MLQLRFVSAALTCTCARPAPGAGNAVSGLPAPPYAVVSPCFNGVSSLALLRTSYGFGLRWFSPLGPLRFEWGFPFKPLPYEESNVFEFTIGNFF